MSTINTLVLIGGISSTSINKQLFAEIQKHYKGNLSFSTFDIASLPFFSQDLENNPPAVATAFKDMVQRAQAVLLITPEYNRSFPGVLKNAIDWGSRPYGENRWADKPAAILGASVGPIGTFGAQQHLRNVCSYLGMHLMSQPESYINASAHMPDGTLTDKAVAVLQKYMDSFEQWAQKLLK